jgi:DNA gyrase subunit B
MQFDKIVITADQDSDGMAIELLLITFFYTYMRPLVEAGKLYRAVTPLYIVETKNQKYYLYTEKELEDWKQTHTEKYELSHCKGLGEISAQTLKEVCFEHQRYKRITVSDADATKRLLEVLEGTAVQPRKQFLYDNATQLGFNFV